MEATITDSQLESLIAMDLEDLEREASFAEGFAFTDAKGIAWEAAVQEELQARIASLV